MASTISSEKEMLVDPQIQKNAPRESAGNPAEMATEIKKKKKKVIQVADCDVKNILSYKPANLDGAEVPEMVIRKDPMLAAIWYDMLADMAMFNEINNAWMLEKQKDYRQQLRTKGRVTYEVEVDEDDNSNCETTVGSSRGGRRRHRPGVMKKQDGQTKKLN